MAVQYHAVCLDDWPRGSGGPAGHYRSGRCQLHRYSARHGVGHRIGGAFRGEIWSMGRLLRWAVGEARGGWDSHGPDYLTGGEPTGPGGIWGTVSPRGVVAWSRYE